METSIAPDTTSSAPDDEPRFRPERFRARMAKLGIKPKDWPERCRMERPHLADLLAGRKGEPKTVTALKLAKAAETTVEDLWGVA